MPISGGPPRVEAGDTCKCSEEWYCDEACLNKQLNIECIGFSTSTYQNCSCKEDCGNRKITNKQSVRGRAKKELERGGD